MKIENGYHIWLKGDKLDLSPHFKTSEFSCQCVHEDCKEQKIAVEMVNRLEKIRTTSKSRMEITSGYRCTKHQEDIRKSGISTVVAAKSQHELGNAADIKLLSLTVPNSLPFIEIHFDSIGFARNFTHVDLRPRRADGTKRTWNY